MCDTQRYFTATHLFLLIAIWLPLARSAVVFHHRQYHRSIVLGNYLYVDGGEKVTWNESGNGVQAGWGTQLNDCRNESCLGNITVSPELYTYSIDLSNSWTNDTVVLNSITKPPYSSLVRHDLWLDASNQSFYAYGGGISWALHIAAGPPNALWEFTPNGNTGNWSQVAPTAESIFSSLVRTFGGAGASGNGLGFSLGGLISGQTTDALVNIFPPGLVVFNSSSREWYNVSSLDYSYRGTSFGNGAQFVPSFGPNGLLFILGGAVYASGATTTIQVDPSIVHMYEPISQKWKGQVTSGSIPPPMVNPCVVGAQGENGTYEIFLYGGFSSKGIDETTMLGNVYVLSIPSFTWHSTNYNASYGRSNHACSAFSRYMIITGGQVATKADYTANQDQNFISVVDPWTQGIGVFDLVDMAWTDRYDASASSYKTPQVVKDYYATNARYPSSLTSDEVLSSWFVRDAQASNNPTSSGQDAPHKSSTGAIAGGVVGGVVAILVIGVVLWWFLAKKRRLGRSNMHDNDGSAYSKPELPNSPARAPVRHELGTTFPPQNGRVELRGNTKQLRTQEVHEI